MRKSTKKIQEFCEFLSHTDLHTDQSAQKRHNLVEKPLKMADFLHYGTYCGGHMRKSTKKIQDICEFLSHTDLHTDQRAQKRHNLVEKPLKMADFLLWRPYAKNLPKRYKKSVSYHTQTGYISR